MGKSSWILSKRATNICGGSLQKKYLRNICTHNDWLEFSVFFLLYFCTAQHFSFTHQIQTWSNNLSFFLKDKQILERDNCFLFAVHGIRNCHCLVHLEWSLTQSEWKSGRKGPGKIKCIHFASQHSMNGAFVDVFDIWWNPCYNLVDLTERDAGLIW